MATIRKRYYTMPKGQDGKRRRVWHESDGLTLLDIAARHDNSAAIERVIGILSQKNSILEGIICNE